MDVCYITWVGYKMMFGFVPCRYARTDNKNNIKTRASPVAPADAMIYNCEDTFVGIHNGKKLSDIYYYFQR